MAWKIMKQPGTLCHISVILDVCVCVCVCVCRHMYICSNIICLITIYHINILIEREGGKKIDQGGKESD